MTNFNSIVDFYAEKFAKVLKREGFNQQMYRSVLGTSFAARMFFFENTAGVETVRSSVLGMILRENYSETLTPVEEIFLQTYNGLATALRLPLYEKELFFAQLSEVTKENPYYGSYRLDNTCNRVPAFTPNCHITALAKKYDMVEDAEKKFCNEIKSIASDVITRVLARATSTEKFWY